VRQVLARAADLVREARNLADFVLHLDRLRRRAARGTARQRVGLDALARQAGIPRSTLESKIRALRINKSRFRARPVRPS